MEPTPPGGSAPTAWQPFTFGGVAAFASGSTARLCLVLLGVGLLLGWASVRYLWSAIYPAIETAVPRLPPSAEIRGGMLLWPTNRAVELANTRLVSLVVNPDYAPVPGQAADVVIELTARTLSAQSLFGYWVFPYPERIRIPLNQPELEPLWGAWRPHVQAVLPLVVVVLAATFWSLLAALAAPGLRLLAALARRDVTLAGCWRLAMAAMIPAGLVTTVALAFYASRGFHLIDTLVATAVGHLYGVVLWIGAIPMLPRRQPRSPFVPNQEPTHEEQSADESLSETASPLGPKRSPFAGSPAQTPLSNPFARPLPSLDTGPAPEDPPSAPARLPETPAPELRMPAGSVTRPEPPPATMPDGATPPRPASASEKPAPEKPGTSASFEDDLFNPS